MPQFNPKDTINWIAAVKSKSISESTELSGTDSLCLQGCASFQQLREKLTTVLTEAADNTELRWLMPCISDQARSKTPTMSIATILCECSVKVPQNKARGSPFYNNLNLPSCLAASTIQHAAAKVLVALTNKHRLLVHIGEGLRLHILWMMAQCYVMMGWWDVHRLMFEILDETGAV